MVGESAYKNAILILAEHTRVTLVSLVPKRGTQSIGVLVDQYLITRSLSHVFLAQPRLFSDHQVLGEVRIIFYLFRSEAYLLTLIICICFRCLVYDFIMVIIRFN